jgi:KaiC/GvpD/RAD55 family RecA-like ATPase
MDLRPEEKDYRWLEAAKCYELALHSEKSHLEYSSVAEIWRRIGFCYGRASRQAEDFEEFKKCMEQAVNAYRKAATIYNDKKPLADSGNNLKCLCAAEYLSSWLIHNPAERRKALETCLKLGKKHLQILKGSKEKISDAETYNLLLMCSYDLQYISPTAKEKRKAIENGIRIADQAVSALSESESKNGLIVVLSMKSILNWFLGDVCEEEEKKEKSLAKKCLEYSKKANELSEKSEDHYSKAMSNWAGALCMILLTEKSALEHSPSYAKEMLQNALVLKDNFLIGIANHLLQGYLGPEEFDPSKLKQICEEGITYSKNAIKHLQRVGREPEMTETYAGYMYFYLRMARDLAITLPEKTAFCKKAVKIGKEGLHHAISSGSPTAATQVLACLTVLYTFYSSIEAIKELRRNLLKKSLNFLTLSIDADKKAYNTSLDFAIHAAHKAEIELNLATLEENRESKIALLEGAIPEIELAVSCFQSVSTLTYLPAAAYCAEIMGKLLDEHYSLTENKQTLKKAAEAYNWAARDFERLDVPNRTAEAYWKSALNSDRLDEYQKAAETFSKAQLGYEAAAKRVSQFSDFYHDYADYMKAWSQIEVAKNAHNEEKYEVATHHYENAARLLGASKFWTHLSTNFYAWSLLEYAEDLSRKENSQGSSDAFKKAIKLLQESKRVLNMKLDSYNRPDEETLAKKLIEVSGIREEYSNGRILIEEAKMLAKKGERKASSNKYEEAAAIFEKITLEGSEQISRDSKPLSYLCHAWQKMTLAEAKSIPMLYNEAAELFKLASESASKESTGLTALGHSAFCKALEAGMEFEITRTMATYDEAVRYIEAAANYYVKAGFESASDYAKGTQRLFEAYVFMEYANKERDPGKQARYYSMAEKVLDLAMKVFEKTRYQDKMEQVQRLLKEVKEKRQLALSLSEIFHAQTNITSVTTSFSSISPSEEVAVGLERFEHAEIQSKIVQHETEANMGSTVDLEIQIVNVGKEPVMLTKIKDLVPPGFQLVGKPSYCRFENATLTVGGRRLDPLRTEEIKLSLRSLKKGAFELRPRIVCVDQTGREIAHSPEPIAFKVSCIALPGRVPTGYTELDDILFGGIPDGYSVILTAPSSDERELLIEKFLEVGARNGQLTYFVTAETGNTVDLAERCQNTFYLFLCNPRADLMIDDFPNVSKIKGVESLTDIDIAIIKSLRTLNPASAGPKRACISIISDVLLQHHAVVTRKWLTGLLQDLKSKGFTSLGVIDPQMHPPEEVQAILGLFEGEIRVLERETEQGVEERLRITKMYNQKYIENEIILTKERRES